MPMAVTKVTYYCYDLGVKGQPALLLVTRTPFLDRGACFAKVSLWQGKIYKIRLLLLFWTKYQCLPGDKNLFVLHV